MRSEHRSCSKLSSLLSAEFLSNHFGANISAAAPHPSRPSSSPTRTRTKACGGLRKSDHPKPKRHPQPHIPLHQTNFTDPQTWRVHSVPLLMKSNVKPSTLFLDSWIVERE